MGDTRDNVRPSYVWLALAASLPLIACYAEVPGSAPGDDAGYSFDGGDAGGTTAGGTGGGNPGGSDSGIPDPGDGGGIALDATTSGCDGMSVGATQTRKLYAEAQVVPPATCKSETQTRTCRAAGWSAWSGTFQAESCMQAAYQSCGALAHGATSERKRYPEDVVDDTSKCVPETQTQTCDNGTLSDWTGSAEFETCEVDFLGRCSLLSDYECIAGTTCPLRFNPVCVGTAGHSCSANSECNSGVCVSGTCLSSKPSAGGACDETVDCAACATATSGTTVPAVCTTGGTCACAATATCTLNSQCQGTCVALRCVAPNSTCDMDDDCNRDTSKCVKTGGPASTGTCLLKDGQTCTTNTQCEHVCRPLDTDETFAQKACAPLGTLDAESHCDENVDCMGANIVCRHVGNGPHCSRKGTLPTDYCDEAADCASGTVCSAVPALGTVCYPIGGTGASCTSGEQCMSGTCTITTGVTGTCT